MHVVYLDEAGYTGSDWIAGMQEQPFYVLAAVAVDIARVDEMYQCARKEMASIGLPEYIVPLGLGYEIKAKDIAKGNGWWQGHNTERNAVRDLMLTLPKRYDAYVITIVVDKERHKKRYSFPDNPYLLALQFALERMQLQLMATDEKAICIYDENDRLSNELSDYTTSLVREGSKIEYFSNAYEAYIKKRFQLTNILEFTHANSDSSIGLQFADFFASLTYQYYKAGKPKECGWWNTLTASLAKRNGEMTGIGLKEFPGTT